MLKARRQTGMSSLAVPTKACTSSLAAPTTPRHKSTSKLPAPREDSALRKSKSCTKVRPVPDFSKLHQKMQTKLDRAKTTSKKPPVPRMYDLHVAEVGSPDKDIGDDGHASCDLIEPDLIQSLTSLADIQEVLADHKYKTNTEIISSPISTPYSVKTRQILGELAASPNSPLRELTTGKRKTGHTDDMEFKSDPAALQSILTNKGITTEEFASITSSAIKRATFLSPGRVLRPPNSIKKTPTQNHRQSIFCSMTDVRTSFRKSSKAVENEQCRSVSRLSRTCDQPRRVRITDKESLSAFMGQFPIRNSIYMSNKKSIRTPVQNSGSRCSQKKITSLSTPDLLASPDVAKADLKSVKKRLHWADGLSPTEKLDFAEDCRLATELDEEEEDLTASKYEYLNARVNGQTMQMHPCVDKVDACPEDVQKDIRTGQADHSDGPRVENTLHRLQQLELLEKQLVCDLKDIESDIIKDNETLSFSTVITSNDYDDNNNNDKSQDLICKLATVEENSTADSTNYEQSRCLSAGINVIKPEACSSSNINDYVYTNEGNMKLSVTATSEDVLCPENYNSKPKRSLSSHGKAWKKRRSIDELNQTLHESRRYISELTQIEEDLHSNNNNDNNNNGNVEYVNKVKHSDDVVTRSANASHSDGTIKRSDIEKQLELVQKQQQELVQVQNRLKALLVTDSQENTQNVGQILNNVIHDSPTMPNVDQVIDNTTASYSPESQSFKSLVDSHSVYSARSGLRSSKSVYCLPATTRANNNSNSNNNDTEHVKANSLKTSKTVHNLIVDNIEDKDTHFLLKNDLDLLDISTDKNDSDPSSSNVRIPLQVDVCALDNVLDLTGETSHNQLSQEQALLAITPSQSLLAPNTPQSIPSAELPLFCARSAFSEYSSACNGNANAPNLDIDARAESASAAAVADTNISNRALLCHMRESVAASQRVVSHSSAERQTTLLSANTSCLLPVVESALTAAAPGTSKRQNATTVETNHHDDRANCGKVFSGRENQGSVINQFDNDQVCGIRVSENGNDCGNIGAKCSFVETRFKSCDDIDTHININNNNNNNIIFSINNPVSVHDKFVDNSDNLIDWLSATDSHCGIRQNKPVVGTTDQSYSAFTHGNVCREPVPMQEDHREAVWSGSDIPLDLTTNTCNTQRHGLTVNTGVSSEESHIAGRYADSYTSGQMSRSSIPARLLSSFSTPNLQTLSTSSFQPLNPVVNRYAHDIASSSAHITGTQDRHSGQSVFAFPGQYHQQQRPTATASNSLSQSRTGSLSKSYVSSSVLPRPISEHVAHQGFVDTGSLSVIGKPVPVSFSSSSHLDIQLPTATTSSQGSVCGPLFSKVKHDFQRKGFQQNLRSTVSHVQLPLASGAFSSINQRLGSLNGQRSASLNGQISSSQRSGSLNGQMSNLLTSSSSPFIPSSRSTPSFDDDDLLDDECSWYNGSLVGQMEPSRCSNPVAAMLMAGDNQHFLPIHED